MPSEMLLLIFVVVAGAYMAWNIGANDVANAMGTSVGSGALTLKQAVIIAAILEFSGAFFFGSHVSETIQKGIVDPTIFKDPIIVVYGMLSALLAAGVWLQIASFYGWPVSTTHSIVGAIVGFGTIIGGMEAIYWEHVLLIGFSWILSPLLGGLLSYLIFDYLRRKIFYAPNPVHAAKKITPTLVFCLFFILSLIMLYKGLSNIDLQLNFFQCLSISLICSFIAFFVSKICLNQMKLSAVKSPDTDLNFNPEIPKKLEKAKKHLLYVQEATKGVVHYQASELLDEIHLLSESIKNKGDSSREKDDYAVVERIFGYLQIMSACLMAFAHGANDVANAIGPLSAAIDILTTGVISAQASVPTWSLGLGGIGIVIGLATWGWRVIETIGKKITELTPTRGFSAEFGAACTILLASRLGLPISTTHTLVGSVIGIGLARGIEALDLRTTRQIVISWLVTVPAGAILSILFFLIIKAIF